MTFIWTCLVVGYFFSRHSTRLPFAVFFHPIFIHHYIPLQFVREAEIFGALGAAPAFSAYILPVDYQSIIFLPVTVMKALVDQMAQMPGMLRGGTGCLFCYLFCGHNRYPLRCTNNYQKNKADK